jgi:hypothetical protein
MNVTVEAEWNGDTTLTQLNSNDNDGIPVIDLVKNGNKKMVTFDSRNSVRIGSRNLRNTYARQRQASHNVIDVVRLDDDYDDESDDDDDNEDDDDDDDDEDTDEDEEDDDDVDHEEEGCDENQLEGTTDEKEDHTVADARDDGHTTDEQDVHDADDGIACTDKQSKGIKCKGRIEAIITSVHIKFFDERLAVGDELFVTMNKCQNFDTDDSIIRKARDILKTNSDKRKEIRESMKKKFTTVEEYDNYKPYIMLSFMTSYPDFDKWKEIKTDTSTGSQKAKEIKRDHFKGDKKAYASFLKRFRQKPIRQFEAMKRILFTEKKKKSTDKKDDAACPGKEKSSRKRKRGATTTTTTTTSGGTNKKGRKGKAADGEETKGTAKRAADNDAIPHLMIKLCEQDRENFQSLGNLSDSSTQSSREKHHKTG